MLSTMLNNDRAIEVNIQIMRAFVRLWEMHFDLRTHNLDRYSRKLADMEKKYDTQFKVVADLPIVLFGLRDVLDGFFRDIGSQRARNKMSVLDNENLQFNFINYFL